MVRQLKKVFVMCPGRFAKKTVWVSAAVSGLLAGARQQMAGIAKALSFGSREAGNPS